MSSNKNKYQPGHCNIGLHELMVRRKFLKLFIFLNIILTAASFYWPWSIWIWLGLVFTGFSGMVLWMELRYHFCILFGFFSLHNFKQLGNLDEVTNPEYKKKDRKRVWEILVVSMMFSLFYSCLIHSLASTLR